MKNCRSDETGIQKEKHKIAAYAAELIEADDFYLDAGSSVGFGLTN